MTVSILFKSSGQMYDWEHWETKVEGVFENIVEARNQLAAFGTPVDGVVRTTNGYMDMRVYWVETHEVK